jgi:hypothetical protein
MYLRATVESSGKQEVVFPEPLGMIFSEVVLRIESETECSEDRAINPNAEVSERP